MNSRLESLIRETTLAGSILKVETIQSLWSGYGDISRFKLGGCDINSIIVKHVRLPEEVSHPRGWHSNLSHQRKLHSYHVECNWYRSFADSCHSLCRVPKCFSLRERDNEFLILLEDLNVAGFTERLSTASMDNMLACIRWLANFHATFMGVKPEGLWSTGSYWHLATRPDELEALSDEPLKLAAEKIDQRLQDCPYQTLIHGDAKLANFCFTENDESVAAVDFQYVGGGCGMKDLAYFIGSCLDEAACGQYVPKLLDAYFNEFSSALKQQPSMVDPQEIEQAWRPLFPFAWTDFHRFMKGWSPGHWKIHGYSEGLAKQVILKLKQEEALQ